MMVCIKFKWKTSFTVSINLARDLNNVVMFHEETQPQRI